MTATIRGNVSDEDKSAVLTIFGRLVLDEPVFAGNSVGRKMDFTSMNSVRGERYMVDMQVVVDDRKPAPFSCRGGSPLMPQYRVLLDMINAFGHMHGCCASYLIDV